MLRDNLVEFIEPMLISPRELILSPCAFITSHKHRTIDSHALKIPAPQGRNLH